LYAAKSVKELKMKQTQMKPRQNKKVTVEMRSIRRAIFWITAACTTFAAVVSGVWGTGAGIVAGLGVAVVAAVCIYVE
jgi:hypothetical protein